MGFAAGGVVTGPAMNPLRLTLCLVASLVAFAVARPAEASDKNPQVPSSVVDEAQRWLAAAYAGPTAASDPTSHGSSSSTTAERAAAATTQQPFVDFSPNASVVARDWSSSMKIVGERTMLLDETRPTASNRMLMGRLATDARLTAFAQVGVGEWRIDPVMFPTARSYSEMAGQIGSGFELRLRPNLRVGGEVQYTILYHDMRYTPDEVAPRMLAFFGAIQGRF